MRDYHKYNVWAEAHDLVQFIYKSTIPLMPEIEKYELTRQLRRAAYSVPINIVEGSGRHSEKDFAHFLDMSLGSILEVEYCCLLAGDLEYINPNHFEILNKKVNNIKGMMIGLIKSIRSSGTKVKMNTMANLRLWALRFTL